MNQLQHLWNKQCNWVKLHYYEFTDGKQLLHLKSSSLQKKKVVTEIRRNL